MIKTAKFDIPVNALIEFIDFINNQGLKATVILKQDDMYKIEIPYTKEQSHIVEGIQDFMDVMATLALASLSVLNSLIEAGKNIQTKTTSKKPVQKSSCIFKDFILQKEKK